MATLLDMLQQQIGDDEIQRLSRSLGADEDRVRSGVAGALPLLVSALANNARDPSGARDLAGALERDHDGGLLDQVGDFLGGGDAGPGAAILEHVLGGRRPAAQQGVGQLAGLDSRQAAQLLALLAPIVMAVLGRVKRQRSMGSGDLAGMLGQERETLRKQGGGGDLLTSLLDSDGDGQVMDDVLEKGAGLLGGFFKRRR